MMTGNRKLGSIEFSGDNIAIPAMKFDRIAHTRDGVLLALSVIGEAHNIKRIRAILAGGARVAITASGVDVREPRTAPGYSWSTGRLSPSEDGYHTHVNHLDYSMMHAVFLTKMAGFMVVVDHDTLWRELKDVRFTTPIIPEWMTYIERRLRDEGLLMDARVFNCRCGVLSATTRQLDDIVCEGIKMGKIHIPKVA